MNLPFTIFNYHPSYMCSILKRHYRIPYSCSSGEVSWPATGLEGEACPRGICLGAWTWGVAASGLSSSGTDCCRRLVDEASRLVREGRSVKHDYIAPMPL